METLLNPEIEKVSSKLSQPELGKIPMIVKLSLFNKIKAIRNNIGDSSKTMIPRKSIRDFLLSKNKSKFDNFQEAINGFEKHCRKVSFKSLATMITTRKHRGSINPIPEGENDMGKTSGEALHQTSRSALPSTPVREDMIEEDLESIEDDSTTTDLSEMSLRKQIQHHEQKENMKYIKELQQRMSKREMQERNKERMAELTMNTNLYSNKFSLAKIHKKVKKQREEKKAEIENFPELSEGRKLEILSHSNLELFSLNGFLNGYNDKLSLNSDPRSTIKSGKGIHLDSLEYHKAKDIAASGHKDAYEIYQKCLKSSKLAKLRRIKAKVQDCLTAQDILKAYKRNIK